MTKSDGGKGSSPRPFSIAQEQYEARWDMIFGRDSVAGRDKGDKERDVKFDKVQAALDKKADNARELGLDYDPTGGGNT
jgi:hypothetical protein